MIMASFWNSSQQGYRLDMWTKKFPSTVLGERCRMKEQVCKNLLVEWSDRNQRCKVGEPISESDKLTYFTMNQAALV
jgi:hypothetical protein